MNKKKKSDHNTDNKQAKKPAKVLRVGGLHWRGKGDLK